MQRVEEEETLALTNVVAQQLVQLRTRVKNPNVAANIIKAALRSIFYINIKSDVSLNQQPSLKLCCFQTIFPLLLCRTKGTQTMLVHIKSGTDVMSTQVISTLDILYIRLDEK